MLFDFPKTKRLLNSQDFSFVFDEPFRSSDRSFTILARKNQATNHARIGLAIAKKHLKRAHDRNLVKRLIRESFRLNIDKLDTIDIVVLVKPSISLDNRESLHKALNNHWQRINELCKKS